MQYMFNAKCICENTWHWLIYCCYIKKTITCKSVKWVSLYRLKYLDNLLPCDYTKHNRKSAADKYIIKIET